jgi:DNA-binding PadR family transcriptional regulator
MRITSFINNSKCIEWDLTMQQGALFDLLNQLHTWAEPIAIDGEIYYWASKQMICNEIPLAYNKVDTVYRALKTLREKGLINYRKHGEKDCISLTAKGKGWNSEINPTLGNKSEQTRIEIRETSEINPTYKNTNINNTKISNIKKINKNGLNLSDFQQQPSEQVWNDFVEHRKNKKAKLTQTALNLLIKQINACLPLGYTTDDVLAECMARGWVSVKVDWLQNTGNFQRGNAANSNKSLASSMRDDTSWIHDMGNVL